MGRLALMAGEANDRGRVMAGSGEGKDHSEIVDWLFVSWDSHDPSLVVRMGRRRGKLIGDGPS